MGGWRGSSQLWFCFPSPPAQTHKLGPLKCQVISTSKRSRISTINPQQSTRSHPTYIKLQRERTAGCHTRAFYVSAGLPSGVLLTVVGRPTAPREQCARARRPVNDPPLTSTTEGPSRDRPQTDLTEDQGSLRLGKGRERSSFWNPGLFCLAGDPVPAGDTNVYTLKAPEHLVPIPRLPHTRTLKTSWKVWVSFIGSG